MNYDTLHYAAAQWHALRAALGLDDAATYVGVVTELKRLRGDTMSEERAEYTTMQAEAEAGVKHARLLDELEATWGQLKTAPATDHRILLAVQRQVQGLVAERDALRAQLAAVVAERDGLRAALWVKQYRIDIGHEGEYVGRTCALCNRWESARHADDCPAAEA